MGGFVADQDSLFFAQRQADTRLIIGYTGSRIAIGAGIPNHLFWEQERLSLVSKGQGHKDSGQNLRVKVEIDLSPFPESA